jgi:hypothetical protein
MLGLTLREEFRGKRLKGTAIELSDDTNTGAIQVAAKAFLEIRYPTHDLLKGIEAVGMNKGQPLAVIGERVPLVGYALWRWSVDYSTKHSLNPKEHHHWLKNSQTLYGVESSALAPGYETLDASI